MGEIHWIVVVPGPHTEASQHRTAWLARVVEVKGVDGRPDGPVVGEP